MSMLRSIISSATFVAAATADLLVDRLSVKEDDNFFNIEGGIALGVNIEVFGRF